MFLTLGHTKLDVYQAVQELLLECYLITENLPSDERFNLTQQIKRAAVSVKLNLAEGASRRSEMERKRYYEIARGSVIELDAAIEVCLELKYLLPEKTERVGLLIIKSYSMLTRMTAKT
jgi:four helix bundle protein